MRMDIGRLARHKVASHVVECALLHSSPDVRQMLKDAMASNAEEISHRDLGATVPLQPLVGGLYDQVFSKGAGRSQQVSDKQSSVKCALAAATGACKPLGSIDVFVNRFP
eukprot:Skav213271  [mRNA]  locus=scaffold2944:82170:82979:+ [translate_table: standard]